MGFAEERALYALGRYREALADFERADQLRPQEPYTLVPMAYSLACLSRYSEALRTLHEAAQFTPPSRSEKELRTWLQEQLKSAPPAHAE
jgi:tetratricopeptide (TPR) repeat protein